MATARTGILGGSGLYQMPELKDIEEIQIDTPFGKPSDAFIVGTLDGVRVAFPPRHGRGHRFTPSELPFRANIYAMKGMYDKSPLESMAGLSLGGYPPEDVAALRAAFTSSGTQGFWREWINQSESRLKRGEYVPAMLLATLHTRLEERDKAFYWFNKAFEDRESGLAFLKVSPLFDSLRSDPRFQELMRRVGLPQ